jgi:heat-inducible transcriptional repressor
MIYEELSERERLVLEAVVETYVETAEPAGSRTIAKRSRLGVSAATIRNTMSDLEDKGYLFHPHTSAGRVPTDSGYRAYVDTLTRASGRAGGVPSEAGTIRDELASQRPAIEGILRCAASVLGVLTQELGVAAKPSLSDALLERLELIPAAGDRVLLVLTLRGGSVKTIFVDVRSTIASEVVAKVALILNERLAGLPLREVRATMAERLRDAASERGTEELLNIFVQEAEDLFQSSDDGDVMLGSARVLAEQPEFASNEQMRSLLTLTERRDVLAAALTRRADAGLTITIGSEHRDPNLNAFTLVTASYRSGPLSGVIGVIGPTRMPYEKIIALVDHTSRLIGDVLQ